MIAPATSGWTAGRIVALVAGSVLLLISLVLIGAGGALTWADHQQLRSGYLTTSTTTYSTSGYALATDPVDLPAPGAGSTGSRDGSGSGSLRPTRPGRSSRASRPPVTPGGTWPASVTPR